MSTGNRLYPDYPCVVAAAAEALATPPLDRYRLNPVHIKACVNVPQHEVIRCTVVLETGEELSFGVNEWHPGRLSDVAGTASGPYSELLAVVRERLGQVIEERIEFWGSRSPPTDLEYTAFSRES